MLPAKTLRDADDRLIFRYDNAPHHTEVKAFPHHKRADRDSRIVRETMQT